MRKKEKKMSEKKLLKRREFKVNGFPVPVMANDDEILSDVIRKKMGLTGTKVGCRLNQCGICSVLVDGKVVRSCLQKVGKLEDGAEITTIEGIGTVNSPHPLQLAWAKHGAAQCGICAPGFIVSAKGLLDENNNPTREEVRDWFYKNKNLCRCTGYKPIVDAVMDAAKALRGEIKAEDLEFKMPADGRIWNTHYPRPSAMAKATGTFAYGADTYAKNPDAFLKLALVHARVSHANIISIDTSEAEKMPGVVAVLTAKDVKGTNRINGCNMFPWSKNDGFDRPIINDTKVFQFGDVLAVVAADTEENAKAAADVVKLNLEELPAYMNAMDAIAEDAIEIHPGVPNLFYEQPLIKGEDPAPLLEKSACVVEELYYCPRQPHLVLENDVGYGFWDESGKLTICSKHIGAFFGQFMLQEGLGIEEDKIRFVQNGVGGTFGYKLCNTVEQYIAVAVMATGQPCYCEMDMYNTITYTGKRSPFTMNVKIGADKDGILTGLETKYYMDHGPYSEFGDGLLNKGHQYLGGGYHLENIRGYGGLTFTNHAYGAPCRAYGSPESFTASESMMDELARRMGEDPFEFRYKNLYDEAKGSLTPVSSSPDVYVFKQLFDMMRPKYEEAKKRKQAPAPDGVKRGVGISLGYFGAGNDCEDAAEAAVELLKDGRVAVYVTWHDHGQGGDMGALAYAHESLKELKLSPDRFVLITNDTAKCPDSGPAAASRSQVMIGNALYEACDKLKKAMLKEGGTYRTYDEMIKESLDVYYVGAYDATPLLRGVDEKTGQFDPHVTYMYAVYLSEIAVDTKTGKVEVNKMTAAYDVGVIGNKAVVEGQAYGGLMMGIGLALSEDFEDLKKHTTLMNCGFPTIKDCPDDMELMFMETPRKHSALGSSGVGESVLTSPHVSIVNAIDDACGARVRILPATPDKILAALKK